MRVRGWARVRLAFLEISPIYVERLEDGQLRVTVAPLVFAATAVIVWASQGG